MEKTSKTTVLEQLLSGQSVSIEDQGWTAFTVQATENHNVGVVVTPCGEAFVGSPDEDGILWVAGIALVTEGGDTSIARKNSISWTPGCRVARRVTRGFRVARGYGQRAVLMVDAG